jgi:exopolysaccharide biosynthesis polyprenyl glycosylphosphotransferase
MDARRFRTFFSISLAIIDSAMLTAAFALGYRLRKMIAWPSPAVDIDQFPSYLTVIVLYILSVLFVFFLFRMYHLGQGISRVDELYAVAGGVTVGILLAVALTVLVVKNTVFEVNLSRMMIIYTWACSVVLVELGRLVFQQLRVGIQGQGVVSDRVIIVGEGDLARLVIQKVRGSPFLGYAALGLVTRSGAVQDSIEGLPVLGRPADLPGLIEKHRVDGIIIALADIPDAERVELISLCHHEGVNIKVFAGLFDIMATGVTIDDLGGLPLLNIRDVALRGWNMSFKRLMDIAGSALILILTAPLMLLIAVLIKLDSPGPTFFIQERMGLDSKPFPVIKFRSMRKDAEADGAGWTVKDDPRKTRLGAIIRKYSLDEFPQFINVLLGDMSLVGPRPEQPAFVEQFRRQVPRYMDRHHEKAGVTGWAQVNGLRGDTSIAERTKYDLWYIENWSIWLDIKIIIRTIFGGFIDRSVR